MSSNTRAVNKSILWLDNDPGMLRPFLEVLEQQGIEVKTERSVRKAEEALRQRDFDLLILDVMIPTIDEEEEREYPPEESNRGGHTGLVFYQRHRAAVEERGIEIFVFTVRADRKVQEQFMAAGLRREMFATKLSLRDVDMFVSRIKEILGL